MKRSTLLAIMLLCAYVIVGQNIEVTFTGTGEVTVVDSVTARNMSTGEEITLPGNETLILENTSGISDNFDLKSDLKLFPNPVQGNSKLMFNPSKAGIFKISIHNLSGQTLFQSDQYLEIGQNIFELSFSTSGIFMINITGENEKRSIKAICLSANAGAIGLYPESVNPSSFKSFNNTYSLVYSPEDVLNFRCKSGSYTTIMTDSPTESQNYEIEFIGCTDPQSNTYSVIKIGDQIWMAENLAYLPTVTSPSNISNDDTLNYVYNYSGSSIEEAMNTQNYKEYGALYNWKSALVVCPDGWHLPDVDEWESLILYLERNGYGFYGYANMIGKSLASTSGWRNRTVAGTVGKDQASNNKSGFCILPAGYLYYSDFVFQGDRNSFWSSSTAALPMSAYSYLLGSDMRQLGAGRPEMKIAHPIRCIKDN